MHYAVSVIRGEPICSVTNINILSILPNKETARALEAETRENILREADDAVYKRRNAAVEQERKIKENELNTQIANFIFGKNDTVITVGQDGLIANTLKYLEAQKLIGINPDPSRWDGVLSQFSVDETGPVIRQALNDEAAVKQVTKAKVQLSDNQVLYAVNDFFIGVKNHASARYAITVDGAVENQSSSGIIVSTPLGRSGWMKSVLAGASGITGRLSKQSLAIKAKSVIDWGKEQLTFAVREPFPSVNTGTKIIFGSITPGMDFCVESRMGENGIIFSDGIQDDYLDFNYSVVARISIADSKGNIVVK